MDEQQQSSGQPSSGDKGEVNELIPEALNDLVAVLETKAAKYNLSRCNVKNILKHVMQSEEMVTLLRDELDADGRQGASSSSSSSSAPVFGSSNMRMTRNRFHQFAGDKVCPDLEVLLSQLPPGPSAPKSFFDLEFPEDDPEDAEYDPRLEDEELYEGDVTLVSPGIASSRTPSVATAAAIERQQVQTPAAESVTTDATTPTTKELIACRTRSRYPLPDFDLDMIAPLPPELHLDADSMSPTSPSRGRRSQANSLIGSPSRHRASASPSSNHMVDDDEIYAQFLATVFDDDVDSRSAAASVLATTEELVASVVAPPSVSAPEHTLMSGTDEEQDDPDYNPFQDIDSLLEFDPDEYAWDKRARIPKEEVRTLRKEAFAQLPIHCHLLETCAEAVSSGDYTAAVAATTSAAFDSFSTPSAGASSSNLIEATPNKQMRKRPRSSQKKQRQKTQKKLSNSSSNSDNETIESPSSTAKANKMTKTAPLLQADSQIMPNASQVLVVREQMRKHIQLLLQTYIIAGNAPEARFCSQQSLAYLHELETLRCAAPNPEATCFNAFNLPSALEFIEKYPPESIGSPKTVAVPLRPIPAHLQHLPTGRKRRRVDAPNILRPKLSRRQMDLMAFHCPALLYAGILPAMGKGFCDPTLDFEKSKRVLWLPSEDDLLALGLEQFWTAAKLLKEKASLIQKYVLPAKTVLNIRARMKNVFYGAYYSDCTSNPIKIFQQYGMAPEYEIIVCDFRPEEVVPLRFLPRHCLPGWFQSRLHYWEREEKKNDLRLPADQRLLTYLVDEDYEESEEAALASLEDSDDYDDDDEEDNFDFDDSNANDSRNFSVGDEHAVIHLEGDLSFGEIELPRGTHEDQFKPGSSSNISNNNDNSNNNISIGQGELLSHQPTLLATSETTQPDPSLSSAYPIELTEIRTEAEVVLSQTSSFITQEKEEVTAVKCVSFGCSGESLSTRRQCKTPTEEVIDLNEAAASSTVSSPRSESQEAVESDDSLQESTTMSTGDIFSSPVKFASRRIRKGTVDSSPSLGHGGFSSVDEEAAVFLTPVKSYRPSDERRQFDSDPRSSLGAAVVDAASSDSVPANQRFSSASGVSASPLRARQPLLARLLASLTPSHHHHKPTETVALTSSSTKPPSVGSIEQQPSSANFVPVAVVIAPVSAPTSSANQISPAVRPKRVRRTSPATSSRSDSGDQPRKLRLIAPAPIVPPPPKSLLDCSENTMTRTMLSSVASPSPSKRSSSKVIDSIRARAFKQSRSAAVKRNLLSLSGANTNSNANPPQFDDSMQVGEPLEKTAGLMGASGEFNNFGNGCSLPLRKEQQQQVAAVGRRRPIVKRRHPPRLNEKQRQRLVEMLSASQAARQTASASMNSVVAGPPLPIYGLATGLTASIPDQTAANALVENEIASNYLTLLESSLPNFIFVEVLKILDYWNSTVRSNNESVDVKAIYGALKSLLQSAGRPDLIANFACFLTSHQAFECGCYENFLQFDAACDFLTMHQQACGGRNSAKGLQSLTRLISSSSSSNKPFSTLESEFSQILNNQPFLVEQLAAFFPDHRPFESNRVFTADPDSFETIDLLSGNTTAGASSDSLSNDEFELVRLPPQASTYGSANCPCDCHLSGLAGRVSAFVASQLSEFKRHCRCCGLEVSDGKLYVPDPRTGYRLKRISILTDKYQQLLKHYLDKPQKPTTSGQQINSSHSQLLLSNNEENQRDTLPTASAK